MPDLVQFGSTYQPAALVADSTQGLRRFFGTTDPSNLTEVVLAPNDEWHTVTGSVAPAPPPTPSPTPTPTVSLATLGAAESQSTATTKFAELKRDEGMVGIPMPILRYYDPGSASVSMPPSAPAGRRLAMSWKPSTDGGKTADVAGVLAGNYDTGFTSALKALPSGSYATIWHEPETHCSASDFDKMLAYFCTLSHSVAPHVLVGPIAMEYQIRANSSTYAYGASIDTSLIDFWGYDTYSTSSTKYRTLAQCGTQYAIPYFNGLAKGKPFLMGEVGIDAGYTGDRSQWLYDGLKWGAANNHTILYFNENKDNTYMLTDSEWTGLGTLIAAGK